MNAKKICALLLAVAMMVSVFAGCGSAPAEQPADAPAATQAPEAGAPAAPEAPGESYNIVMQIVTWGNAPDEVADVEAAINAIVEPEIGVTVTLLPIAAWDLANESNITVAAGEKLDLLCVFTFGQSMDALSNYTSKNMLRPLNELYAQYGADIEKALGMEINLGYIGETLYAIPSVSNYGLGSSFQARKACLDEMGITIDPNKYYTVEELEEIFQKYLDTYGAGHYPISVYGGGGTDAYHHLNAIETLGGNGSAGVLLNAGMTGETTVVNLFETEEYMNYCKLMRSWYLNGYLNPDCLTIVDDVTSQMKSGNYLGNFGDMVPGSATGMANTLGEELVIIPILPGYASTAAASQALWTIPTTCENPEKVMQFLNILYQDRELANDVDSILACGVQGISYQVVEQLEGSRAVITGADCPGTWGMWVPGSLYGNSHTTPISAPNPATLYDQIAAYNQEIIDGGRITDAFGYVFDSYPVSAELAVIANVIAQYRSLVGFGVVDPEEVIPEFIQALKDAGIDTVIAENQRQLDIWYASK